MTTLPHPGTYYSHWPGRIECVLECSGSEVGWPHCAHSPPAPSHCLGACPPAASPLLVPGEKGGRTKSRRKRKSGRTVNLRGMGGQKKEKDTIDWSGRCEELKVDGWERKKVPVTDTHYS